MKTLIIYTTRNGSVKEVAQLISKELDGDVTIINLQDDEPKDISDYDVILIGSSIYFGQINKRIKHFISIHRPELLHRKLGIFLLAGEKDKDLLQKQIDQTIPHDIVTKAELISVMGSQIKLKKFSIIVRLLLRYVKKIKSSYKNIDKDKIKEFASNFNLQNSQPNQ